jgi:hypothetical protein
MSTQSECSEDWESYQHLTFLEGEEVYEEIGLDGRERKIFIDDVLETAQWYAILSISHLASPAYYELSI